VEKRLRRGPQGRPRLRLKPRSGAGVRSFQDNWGALLLARWDGRGSGHFSCAVLRERPPASGPGRRCGRHASSRGSSRLAVPGPRALARSRGGAPAPRYHVESSTLGSKVGRRTGHTAAKANAFQQGARRCGAADQREAGRAGGVRPPEETCAEGCCAPELGAAATETRVWRARARAAGRRWPAGRARRARAGRCATGWEGLPPAPRALGQPGAAARATGAPHERRTAAAAAAAARTYGRRTRAPCAAAHAPTAARNSLKTPGLCNTRRRRPRRRKHTPQAARPPARARAGPAAPRRGPPLTACR
jgi:hypothetical protein